MRQSLARRTSYRYAVTCVCMVLLCSTVRADDWPMWRHDAARSGCTAAPLPAELHLQWVRRLPAPHPAWRDASNAKIQFDRSYEPIVTDGLLLLASMVTDSVTAYDARTGDERWRFVTDGPVRFAPVAYNGNVYFGSDDGFIYCLRTADGVQLWRKLGGPDERRILGNQRLAGMWPVRGAPVIHDGTLYVAAGIWPFMGTFIYAMDPGSGNVKWLNSGSGSTWTVQQHRAPAFSGVAPQGYLAATDNTLLVSGGRTVPAAYETSTGSLLYYKPSSRQFGKNAGGFDVSIAGDHFFNGGAAYALSNGAGVVKTQCRWGLYDGTTLYKLNEDRLVAEKTTALNAESNSFQTAWAAPLSQPVNRLFLKAGNTVYGGSDTGAVIALDVSIAGQVGTLWQARVGGKPTSMVAADARLYVATERGLLYCYGREPIAAPKVHTLAQPAERPAPSPATKVVAELLNAASATTGYCIVYGTQDGRLIDELVHQSSMHILVVEQDDTRLATARSRLLSAGVYGTRVSVANSTLASLPPYFARLIIMNQSPRGESDRPAIPVSDIFMRLRPYGGIAYLTGRRAQIAAAMEEYDDREAEVGALSDYTTLRRVGPLPGSAAWTHQYADAANTVVSRDKLVRTPLGVLWFGGPTNDEILPRHGHGPTPQVVGGRVIIEGPNLLRATDAYTGQLLWERTFKGIGRFYDNTAHQPGANEIGSNYVSVEDAIYLLTPNACVVLNPATGETITTLSLPAPAGQPAPNWGSIRVWGDYLIATAEPISVAVPRKKRGEAGKGVPAADDGDDKPQPPKPRTLAELEAVRLNALHASSSMTLAVMNRHTGTLLWSRQAEHSFRHNAIAIGSRKLFCIDGISRPKLAFLRLAMSDISEERVLYAFDIDCGRTLWKTTEDVYGTFLSYSPEHDALVQGGSKSRDRAFDESGTGLTVYQGSNGKVLWQQLERKYTGPCLLHHRTLLSNGYTGFGLDLLTGATYSITNPLTGTPVPWEFSRMYGCNTAIGGEHLMLFRSGAAGYYDLSNQGGTGNFGGFKSGCTASLIPADGLLNAPDYTRTCTCSYQNQTSLALVHMPGLETWTFSKRPWDPEQPVVRMGINVGAPGDRKSDSGTLWLNYPGEGSPSPEVPVMISGVDERYVRKHSLLMQDGALPWVGASAGIGITNVTVTLAASREPEPYTVRLCFAELEAAGPGERVFSVRLQGKPVLVNMDIAREAGTDRSLVREFKGIPVGKELSVTLEPGDSTKPPLISGIELVAE